MKTDFPKITAVIPTYRRPNLLKRAIKSVLNQTYPYFEVRVYDNASGDETAAVVNEFAKKDSRVKYFCHPQNIGAVKNFKYGISLVDTPLFSLLSDDDFLLPKFYEKALQGFREYPEVKFIVTRTYTADASGNILDITPVWDEGLYKPPEGCLKFIKSGCINWTGVLFKKEDFNDDFFDESVSNIIDLNFILNYAARYPFIVLPEPGAVYTLSSSSASGLGRYDIKEYKNFKKMIDNLRNVEELSLYIDDIEQSITKLSQRILFFSGVAGILEKNFSNVYKAADIFDKYYKLRYKSLFLRILADICKKFPFISNFLNFLMKTKKDFRKRNLHKLGI